MSILKSRWFWLLLPVVIVLCAAFAWQHAPPTALTVSPQTTHVTAPLAADGLPDYMAAFDQLAAAGIDPDENAVIPLLRIMGPGSMDCPPPADFYQRLGMEPLPDDGDYFSSLYDFHQPQPAASGALYDKLKATQAKPWSDADYPEIAAWLDHHRPHLAQLSEVVERTQHYIPQWDYTQRKGVADLVFVNGPYPGELFDAVISEAMRDLQRGDADQAFDRALLLHRLIRVRRLSQNPALAYSGEHFEKKALALDEAIAGHSSLTPDAARRFSDLLDELPPLENRADVIGDAERLYALEFLVDIYRNPSELIESFDRPFTIREPHPNPPRPKLDWDLMLRTVNEVCDQVVSVVQSGDAERLQALKEEVDARVEALGGADELGWYAWGNNWKSLRARTSEIIALETCRFMVLSSAVVGVAEKYDTRKQMVRIALALEMYRREHGVYPTTLTDLEGPYLVTIPAPAFKNIKFDFASSGDACLLGCNLSPDNGVPFDLKNNEYSVDDIVLRLPWQPEAERRYPWSEPIFDDTPAEGPDDSPADRLP